MPFPEKNERFVKTENGNIIFPETEMAGNTHAARLQVITDNIKGVVASPKKNSPLYIPWSLYTRPVTINLFLNERMVVLKPSFLDPKRKPEFLKTKHCLL